MSGPTGVTILAPHHDDAVLSCWSLLTAPGDVAVVNVFAGVPPDGSLGWWDRETGASDSAAQMRERRREDAEALGAIGRAAVDLDLLEDQYRAGAAPPAEELRAAVEPHLGAGPVYGPASIGGHPDHLLVRALLGALQRDGRDVRLYADLPYAARKGWPRWIGGTVRRRADREWEQALAASEVDVAPLSPRVVRLDPDAQEGKLRAIRTYRTQLEALEKEGVTDPDVIPFEAFWEPA